MNILKQILFDLMSGIVERWKVFVFVVCVSAVFAAVFFHSKGLLIASGRLDGTISFMDALIYMFRGMEEYRPELKQAFDLTDSYLIWNLVLAFMIGDYPVRELRTTGKNYIIRSRKRVSWWLGKCVWNICSVLAFYVCIYLGIAIAALAYNGLGTTINGGIFLNVFRVALSSGSETSLLLRTFLLPVLSSMAISMFQMLVALVCGGIVGYVGTIVVCGLSAYYMAWFFPGNGLMVYRYNLVNPNGIGIVLPACLCIAIIVICCLAGGTYFENKDIL